MKWAKCRCRETGKDLKDTKGAGSIEYVDGAAGVEWVAGTEWMNCAVKMDCPGIVKIMGVGGFGCRACLEIAKNRGSAGFPVWLLCLPGVECVECVICVVSPDSVGCRECGGCMRCIRYRGCVICAAGVVSPGSVGCRECTRYSGWVICMDSAAATVQ